MGVQNPITVGAADSGNLIHALLVDGSGNLLVNVAAGGTSGTQYADGTTQATPTGNVAIAKNPSNILHALAIDASGNLLVNVAAGGTAGTQFADNAASGATPTGTLAMGWDSANSKVRALKVDASQDLNVNLAANSFGTLTVSGTVTANAGTNLNTSALQLDTTGQAPLVAGGGTTAPSKVKMVGGKTNDGTPQYDIMPLGAGGRSVIIEGFSGGTAVPVSGTVSVTNFANPLPVSQSGNWNVNQTIGVAGFGKVTDGTNTAAVKAASTAPVAADPALVVAISPNTGTLNVSVQNATLAVTQSTSPWVANVSQFGGSNVVTGTGASGAGIPRVTVSNDSNILATQSGTWTVTANQGTANATPWNENVAQFGGSVVVTGTGVSGAGIPRVTVSSDSFPATQPISAISLPLPTNAAQETGGNLATLVTQTRNDAQIVDLLTLIAARLDAINLTVANESGVYFDPADMPLAA